MIQPDVFAAGWVILCDRFKKEFTQFSEDMYYEILSAELTDHEFQFAVSQSFRHEDFFPSPQRLISHAKGALEDNLNTLWNRLTSTRNVQPGTLEAEAWKLAGGTYRLDSAQDPIDVRSMRRDFEAAYRTLRLEQEKSRFKSLPAAPTQ